VKSIILLLKKLKISLLYQGLVFILNSDPGSAPALAKVHSSTPAP